MVILRLIAIVFLVFAAIAVGAETINFVRTAHWTPIAAGQLWLNLDAASLTAIQALIERHILPELWNPGMTWILRQPAWVVASVPGLSLLLLSIDWRQDMPHGWDSAGRRNRSRIPHTG